MASNRIGYSKMYLVPPSIYELLKQCISDLEKKRLEELNSSTSSRPEKSFADIQIENLSQRPNIENISNLSTIEEEPTEIPTENLFNLTVPGPNENPNEYPTEMDTIPIENITLPDDSIYPIETRSSKSYRRPQPRISTASVPYKIPVFKKPYTRQQSQPIRLPQTNPEISEVNLPDASFANQSFGDISTNLRPKYGTSYDKYVPIPKRQIQSILPTNQPYTRQQSQPIRLLPQTEPDISQINLPDASFTNQSFGNISKNLLPKYGTTYDQYIPIPKRQIQSILPQNKAYTRQQSQVISLPRNLTNTPSTSLPNLTIQNQDENFGNTSFNISQNESFLGNIPTEASPNDSTFYVPPHERSIIQFPRQASVIETPPRSQKYFGPRAITSTPIQKNRSFKRTSTTPICNIPGLPLNSCRETVPTTIRPLPQEDVFTRLQARNRNLEALENPYKCHKCPLAFRSKNLLDLHLQRTHKDTGKKYTSWKP